MSFSQPDGPLVSENGAANLPFSAWMTRIHNICFSLQQSGATSNRPTSILWLGRRYFDTTLGIPIWVQSVGPTVWVDATGSPV